MKKPPHKFESEVQLGLLTIILVLLVLNAASNYIAYNARVAERERTEHSLNEAALMVGRSISDWSVKQLSEAQARQLRQQHGLARVAYFPGTLTRGGATLTREDRAALIATGSTEWAELAGHLEQAEIRQANRGEGDEYFYLYPLPGEEARGLIMVGVKAPLLAYLDTAWRTMMIVGIVAAFLVLGVYVLLSRFVLSPFRRLRHEALQAGRQVSEGTDEVEAIVTDYRRIIDELREKESELLQLNREITHRADSLQQFNEHLLRSMNSGLITISQKGRVLSINEVAAAILEVDAAEFHGEHYWDLLGSNVHMVDAVSRVLDCGRNQDYRETAFTTVTGKQLTLGLTISLIHDHKGDNLGASLLINDLSELSALRRQLEAKQRLAALGEMAGGLAHQIRNSLGAVSGYGNLIKKKLHSRGIDTTHALALVQETNEAEALIERFLYFARPLDFSPAAVDVDNLVRDLLAGFRVRPDSAVVQFDYQSSGETLIEADGLLLKQALTNLVENGVNAHGGAPGTVEITLSATDDHLTIEVADSGGGIDDGDADKIFTPFYSTRPSGSGLGLPLVKKIVDLHGGRLTFESKGGQGTVFRVCLPCRHPLGIELHRPQQTIGSPSK